MNLRICLAAAAVAFVSGVTNVATAADLGVSVHVTEPGLYGRVDIGRVPTPPVLVYPQPVIIQQPPVMVQRAPIYLHVPPGHARKWDKHCHRYQACGQPVYFVQENWYREHVVGQRHHDDHKHKKDKKDKKHEKHEKKHHKGNKHDN